MLSYRHSLQAAWLATILVASTAQAVVIGTGDIGVVGGGRIQPIYPIQFQLELAGSLLFDLDLTLVDIGSTYTLDAGDGAIFTDAVGHLTNGSMDTFVYRASIGSAATWIETNEGAVFYGDISGGSGIDFASHPLGSQIVEIAFTVNDIGIDPSGNNGFGIPNFVVRGTLDVVATPEPSASLVWGAAVLAGGLWTVRRRRAALARS